MKKVTKCVWQLHDKNNELKDLFNYFRYCANYILMKGVESGKTSRNSLHHLCYFDLKDDYHSNYIQGATSVAISKLKVWNKRKSKKTSKFYRPIIRKNVIELNNKSYKIKDGVIRIPIKPRQYCYIKLTSYAIQQIKDKKLGSITLTPEKLIIPYSTEIEPKITTNYIGLDRNFDNVTGFDTKGNIMIYDLSKANQIKEIYRMVKSKFKRNDNRIKKKLFSKYGKKEKNRVHQIIHNVSKNIVDRNQGIVMEDLKGIRKKYSKGNGQSKKFRGKMNTWSFYELQRQIEYKAKWNGLPVQFVKAHHTSSKCSVCETKLVLEENRMMKCTKCNITIDRDINASKNILARGVKFAPNTPQVEAMKQLKDAESIVASQDKRNILIVDVSIN